MKRMIRLIALLVCAAMLLSATAMAAGGQIELKDLVINAGEGMALDLSGIGLSMGFAENQTGAGIHVGLTANGQKAADLKLCVQDDKLLIGADGVNSVYSLDLESVVSAIQTQLPSAGGFSISPQDAAAFQALAEEAMMVLSGAVTPLQMYEQDGVSYQIYNISVTADQVDSLLNKLAVLLDRHPELAAQMGIGSFNSQFRQLPNRFSVEGFAAVSENGFDCEVYLVGTDKEDGERIGICLSVAGVSERDADAGAEAIAIRIDMGDGLPEEGFESAFIIDAYMLLVNGEFISFEVNMRDAYYEEDGIYAVLTSPVMDENSHWTLNILTLDEAAGFELSCDADDGVAVIFADDEYVSLGYVIDGAEGKYELNTNVDGEAISIGFASSISADNGEWIIPAGTASTDVLSLTEQQINVLYMEAMTVAINALARMAAANPTIAGMLGDLDF